MAESVIRFLILFINLIQVRVILLQETNAIRKHFGNFSKINRRPYFIWNYYAKNSLCQKFQVKTYQFSKVGFVLTKIKNFNKVLKTSEENFSLVVQMNDYPYYFTEASDRNSLIWWRNNTLCNESILIEYDLCNY